MKKKNFLQTTAKRLLVLVLAVSFCLETACTPKAETNVQQEGVSPQSQSKTQVQQAFSDYLNQLFRSEIISSTLNMHYTLAHPENYGIIQYPVTYGSVSDSETTEASAVLENWEYNLKNYDREELTLPQQMTYDIIMDFIREEKSAGMFRFYQEILKPSSGIQAQLPVLMAEYTFYDEQDIKDYLQLLSCTPDYFQQIMKYEQKRAEKKLFMPEFAAEDVISQCRSFTATPEQNYMFDTFNDRIDQIENLTPEQKESYKSQNHQIVMEQVIPAYNKMAEELDALKNQGINSQGLYYFPKGREYYEYLVSYMTGSDLTIEQMQKQTEEQRQSDLKGLSEISKITPDISQKCASYSMGTKEPVVILQDLQKKMQQDFPAPPDTSFTVKTVHPSLEEYTAPAFYLTPPIDDISQNSIYINGSKNYAKIQLYTTLAHEGFPGHLYQNVMERSCGLEPIRSIFGSGGYAEGWATYVEMQSYYYAEIEKDVAAFLQKNQSAILSLYATADMGIHHDGWSLADTVSFFAKYQITDKAVITEIYQMIVEEPGNYLKYYIGYLEFMNLKRYAREYYGEAFSNYKFHGALMKMGNAPFKILKEYLPKYWES